MCGDASAPSIPARQRSPSTFPGVSRPPPRSRPASSRTTPSSAAPTASYPAAEKWMKSPAIRSSRAKPDPSVSRGVTSSQTTRSLSASCLTRRFTSSPLARSAPSGSRPRGGQLTSTIAAPGQRPRRSVTIVSMPRAMSSAGSSGRLLVPIMRAMTSGEHPSSIPCPRRQSTCCVRSPEMPALSTVPSGSRCFSRAAPPAPPTRRPPPAHPCVIESPIRTIFGSSFCAPARMSSNWFIQLRSPQPASWERVSGFVVGRQVAGSEPSNFAAASPGCSISSPVALSIESCAPVVSIQPSITLASSATLSGMTPTRSCVSPMSCARLYSSSRRLAWK